MSILDKIADERRRAVLIAKQNVALSKLESEASSRSHHSLKQALKANKGTCIIAEIKKASPSAGIIKSEFEPVAIAKAHIQSGAKALSILTEPNYFLGSKNHLSGVRECTDVPILRKDFIIDPYQVAETAAWGADVILLIVALLDQSLLNDLYQQSLSLGLDVLVESHSQEELDAALGLPEAIIGINNRNLKTLKVDLEVSRLLAKNIPETRLSISESGISSATEILEMASLGYDGFLIGEALLKNKFDNSTTG